MRSAASSEAPLSQAKTGFPPVSFVKLLIGNWDGCDMQAQLHPSLCLTPVLRRCPGDH